MVLDELEQKSSPQVLLTWKILCVHHPGLNCSSRISCSFQDVSFTRFWQSLEEEGCKMASTCRAACDPSSDMKAWKSQTLTAQGFHLKEMISTHRHGCCRCFSSKRKQHQNPGEAKREWERERAWHQTERCIQQCIVGRSPLVRLVWMPGRGQRSPPTCHQNCWCQTSRVSLALFLCFHTCSLARARSLHSGSDLTLSTALLWKPKFGYYITSALWW